MTSRYNVAILGASGLVGQRLQDLLYDHPMFRVVAIAGSPNSVGLMHEEIEWRLEAPRPRYDILICSMSDIPDVDIAFSALPNNVAEVVEPSLVAEVYRITLVVLAAPALVVELDSLESEPLQGVDFLALNHLVACLCFNHVYFEDSALKLFEGRLH